MTKEETLITQAKNDLVIALATKAELDEKSTACDDRILEIRAGLSAMTQLKNAQTQDEETDGDDSNSD